MKSTAYIIAEGIDYTYRFCGVTEIEYNFALNIDADTSQGGDIINGARRLPNQIRLSVVETDVSSQPGWSASMHSALDSIRRNRVLCRVVTSMGSWENMLLSEITATQDETNQYGWAGGYCVHAVYSPQRAVLYRYFRRRGSFHRQQHHFHPKNGEQFLHQEEHWHQSRSHFGYRRSVDVDPGSCWHYGRDVI